MNKKDIDVTLIMWEAKILLKKTIEGETERITVDETGCDIQKLYDILLKIDSQGMRNAVIFTLVGMFEKIKAECMCLLEDVEGDEK